MESPSSLNCMVSLIPDTNLLATQQGDPDISTVMESKEHQFPKPPLFVSKSNKNLRSFWNCWDELYIGNGLLVRSYISRQGFSRQRVVIPQSLVQPVLPVIHSSRAGGHLGITRTTFRAKERFFGPRMDESIAEFVTSRLKCLKCSQGKYDPKATKSPLRPIQVSEPFLFWALDYMGPMPETAQGNGHILVMMDHFTQWYEAFPTRDQRHQPLLKFLFLESSHALGHLQCYIQTRGKILIVHLYMRFMG